MKKLILKYNARTGKNHLVKIEEITKRLGLRIEKVEETSPGHQRVAITGHSDQLHAMDAELVRYAAISRKAA